MPHAAHIDPTARWFLPADSLDRMVGLLLGEGYTVIAPTLRDGVIALRPIERADALPRGVGDEQDGGTYRLRDDADCPAEWMSTALADAVSARPAPPPGYQAPPVNWLRGLNLRVELLSDRLSLHATVEMQMPQSESVRGK